MPNLQHPDGMDKSGCSRAYFTERSRYSIITMPLVRDADTIVLPFGENFRQVIAPAWSCVARFTSLTSEPIDHSLMSPFLCPVAKYDSVKLISRAIATEVLLGRLSGYRVFRSQIIRDRPRSTEISWRDASDVNTTVLIMLRCPVN